MFLQDLSFNKDKNISRHAKGLLLALSPNDGGLEWELINTQEKENSEKRAKCGDNSNFKNFYFLFSFFNSFSNLSLTSFNAPVWGFFSNKDGT